MNQVREYKLQMQYILIDHADVITAKNTSIDAICEWIDAKMYSKHKYAHIIDIR